MLGEQIGEGLGKRTGRRLLSVDGGQFKVEVSFEGNGKLLGVDVNEIGTYWAESLSSGGLYGEGQGVVLAADGSVATWKGGGEGKFGAGGAVGYRGAIYYSSASPSFARLNGAAVVFEFDVDAEGNTSSRIWEWK